MTIILTLINSDQTIQLSDRRFTRNGILVDDKDDEHNKGGVFVTSNARLTFGFAGLASYETSYGTFETQKWILSSLVDLAPPDYVTKPILDRLTAKASIDFSKLPSLAGVPAMHKRLSVMFSGYLYHHSPPMAAVAIMTNFQDFKNGKDSDIAWDQFRWFPWNEKRPRIENPILIQSIGTCLPVNESDLESLKFLLTERKPARAIIGKAVEIIRKLADHPKAANSIGKQVSSIILPRDPDLDPISEYHTMKPRSVIFTTSMAIAVKGKQIAIADPEFGVDEPNAPNIVFPKVGRNVPCPCGSGKKYKRCHGKTS